MFIDLAVTFWKSVIDSEVVANIDDLYFNFILMFNNVHSHRVNLNI